MWGRVVTLSLFVRERNCIRITPPILKGTDNKLLKFCGKSKNCLEKCVTVNGHHFSGIVS